VDLERRKFDERIRSIKYRNNFIKTAFFRGDQLSFCYSNMCIDYGSGKFGMADWGKIKLAYQDFKEPFSAEIFASWVSFLFMCCVPTQIICGLVWGCEYPVKVAKLRQPYKGLSFVGISIVGGLLLASIILFTVAQGAVPPGPQHNIFVILFIINMFWLVGVFQCQPFSMSTIFNAL